MKIHIVQKGDTLWNLAEKYGVDFVELKQINSHLSDPDMIMPGMKIKIPTSAVPAKKDGKKKKPLPTFEDLKGLGKKDLPKKEIPKEVSPKKEMIKAEIPKKEYAKAESHMDKTGQLKQLLKETAPSVLKSLLKEVKPDFLDSWSLEFELMKEKEKKKPTPPKVLPVEEVKPKIPPPKVLPVEEVKPKIPPPKVLPVEEVKPKIPAPPPLPEWVMPSKDIQKPLPFKPEEVHPCPPYPPQHHGSYYPMFTPTQQAQPTQPYVQPTKQYTQPVQPYVQPAKQYTQPVQHHAQPIPQYMQPAQYTQPMQPTPSYYPMQGMQPYTSPYLMPSMMTDGYDHGQMSPYSHQAPAPSDCGCAPTKTIPKQVRSEESVEK